MQSSKGFSLIELLASVVIMGVLIAAVLPSLTTLFQGTGRSGQTLGRTTRVQDVAEYTRGQWRSYPVEMVPTPDPVDPAKTIMKDKNETFSNDSRNRFDRPCFASLPALTNTFSPVRALARTATAGATLAWSTNCATAPLDNPTFPMKRITVTLTSADGRRSSTTVDVARP